MILIVGSFFLQESSSNSIEIKIEVIEIKKPQSSGRLRLFQTNLTKNYLYA